MFRDSSRRGFNLTAGACIITATLALHGCGGGDEARRSIRNDGPRITVWYGERQHFGAGGVPQRWVNLLGRVEADSGRTVTSLVYRLNGTPPDTLSLGPDLHRLARPGDFNIELSAASLARGENTVTIEAADDAGGTSSTGVTVIWEPAGTVPPSCHVDLASIGSIEGLQHVCQIVDGLWRLDSDGLQTVEPYYDRVVAVGDTTWSDYDATVTVVINDYVPPTPGPPNYSVTHAGLGLRWRGHADDGLQPRRRWYPVGAATEFTLSADLQECGWRILSGGDASGWAPRVASGTVRLGVPYTLRARVVTQSDGSTRYSVKAWETAGPEPSGWELENVESPDDMASGSLLVVAHHTDVTIRDITVRPVRDR